MAINLIIQSKKDLDFLESKNKWLSRPTIRDITINNSRLETSSKIYYETSIKKLFNDCGCFWGAPTFIVVFTTLLYHSTNNNNLTLTNSGIIFIISILFAVTAKFIGLAWSYFKLQRRLRELKDKFQTI